MPDSQPNRETVNCPLDAHRHVFEQIKRNRQFGAADQADGKKPITLITHMPRGILDKALQLARR